MILVTGGTGLLGSNLLLTLSKQDETIRAIYRDSNQIEKISRLFQQLDPESGKRLFSKIEWRKCDILDVIELQEVMKGCRLVYHCAALVSYRRRDFGRMMKVNGQGTANVVNIALDEKVERLCYVSSTAAVGKEKKQDNYFVEETNKWTQDKRTSGYAISKYTAEKEVWRAMEEGLSGIIINPSVIFGPGNWNESSLTIFRTLSKGLRFYTTGANAFVDVRDVVRAMQLLAESEISGQRYLCTGTNISFLDLFKEITKQLKVRTPNIKAGKWLSGIAWRLDSLFALFTRKQTLTKESVSSAQAKVIYNSSKLEKAFEFEFTPLIETIDYSIKGKN